MYDVRCTNEEKNISVTVKLSNMCLRKTYIRESLGLIGGHWASLGVIAYLIQIHEYIFTNT